MALHKVFVYGTLKSGFFNHHHLIEHEGIAKLIGMAKSKKKWPLVIGSSCYVPYLLYQEDHQSAKNVLGEVYEVDGEKLAVLDKLECHPAYYQRDVFEVEYVNDSKELTGETETVMAYFLKNFKDFLLDLPMLEMYSLDERFIPPKDRTEDTRNNLWNEVLKKSQ